MMFLVLFGFDPKQYYLKLTLLCCNLVQTDCHSCFKEKGILDPKIYRENSNTGATHKAMRGIPYK